jgi:hypothetical protein
LKEKTMQRIHITLLIILSSVFFSAGATAQNKPLACQGDKSAGLRWENGKWVTTMFATENFILIQTKDGLTTESLTKALGISERGVICRNVGAAHPFISCTSWYGHSLVFDPINLNGAVSRLIGATGPSRAERDTLSVDAFSCTPF